MENLTICQLENYIQMEFYQNDLDTIVQSTKYNREILKQIQTTSVYSTLYCIPLLYAAYCILYTVYCMLRNIDGR